MVVIVWSAALKASSKVQFLQLSEGRPGQGSSLAADHCQNVLDEFSIVESLGTSRYMLNMLK